MPVVVGLVFLFIVLVCCISGVFAFLPKFRFLVLYIFFSGTSAAIAAVTACFGMPVLMERWSHSPSLGIISFWAGLFGGGMVGGIIGVVLAHALRVISVRLINSRFPIKNN